VFVCDGDACFVDEDEHGCVLVGFADSEVVHFPGSAEGYFSVFVDVVVADSPGVAEGWPVGMALIPAV